MELKNVENFEVLKIFIHNSKGSIGVIDSFLKRLPRPGDDEGLGEYYDSAVRCVKRIKDALITVEDDFVEKIKRIERAEALKKEEERGPSAGSGHSINIQKSSR